MAASETANAIGPTPGVAGRDWVELGRVLRPHGLDGCLLVSLHSDDPQNLLDATTIALRAAPGTIPFRVAASELAGAAPGGRSRLRLSLEGIDTRERAVVWLDAAVLVPPSALRPLPPGEFYWRDLIGLAACRPDGSSLGRVAEILSTGAADVLVLELEGARDLLLPVVEGLILRLERERGLLWLDPPAELLAEAGR